jgi:hypothetical protein
MPGCVQQQHWHSHVSVRLPFGHGELHEAPSDPAAALTVHAPPSTRCSVLRDDGTVCLTVHTNSDPYHYLTSALTHNTGGGPRDV